MAMTQHFLLSAQARTLSFAKALRLSDAAVNEAFCPRYGCVAVY